MADLPEDLNGEVFSVRTNAEYKHIVEDMIDVLKEAGDGSCASTATVLDAAGYDLDEFELEEMMELHGLLFKAAESNQIILDMSEHEGLLEGLACNLYFIIRKA